MNAPNKVYLVMCDDFLCERVSVRDIFYNERLAQKQADYLNQQDGEDLLLNYYVVEKEVWGGPK